MNTGKASVWFKENQLPKLSKLWDAVKKTGHQPTKIEWNGKTYRRPKGVTDILSES